MLTPKQLEKLLSQSPVAQSFFRNAQFGLLSNNLYNDLYFNSELKQILSRSLESLPKLSKSGQLILRIHDSDPGLNIWRNLDWRVFLLFCVQEYMHKQQIQERRAYRLSLSKEESKQEECLSIKNGFRLAL